MYISVKWTGRHTQAQGRDVPLCFGRSIWVDSVASMLVMLRPLLVASTAAPSPPACRFYRCPRKTRREARSGRRRCWLTRVGVGVSCDWTAGVTAALENCVLLRPVAGQESPAAS